MSNNIWNKLPDPTPDEELVGILLLNEYLSQGYIHRTVTEMLRLPNGTMTYFYRRLADTRNPESPVRQHQHSGWMVDADFCFVNIRATGMHDQLGNFIHAAKMLPAIRANAIHLGPFTDYDFNTIYAVRSVKTISPHVLDPQLSLSAHDQLQAFVQAAHLLGKAVGFDLEPHTAQYSVLVVTCPELFRWIKLAPDKISLADGLTEKEILSEKYQQRITREIRRIAAAGLRQASIYDLEAEEDDSPERFAQKQAVYFGLIRTLIESGYWPVPSQSWAANGVPAFGGYNFDGNYARFEYRGRNGEDQSASAFHILTPYKFYAGLTPNRVPDAANLNQPALDYFFNIFPYWRDYFGFDFVRYDSADHIFDSIVDGTKPASDRPTPLILQTCIENAKMPDKPFVGNFAERMGNEIEDYAALGFDLILGDDMLQGIDAALLEKSFLLYDRLNALNITRKPPASIAFCVDTHDTGNPAFWGEPLVKTAGAVQMGMRHFLSRFLSVGNARRPKYEVMGSQDLSYGLYQANIHTDNLVWVGNEEYNQRYHRLENVYEIYRSFLSQGEITHRHVEPSFAWWMISSGPQRLVPFITFMNIEPMEINLPGSYGRSFLLTEYDFNQTTASTHDLTAPRIEIPALRSGTCLLFAFDQGV